MWVQLFCGDNWPGLHDVPMEVSPRVSLFLKSCEGYRFYSRLLNVRGLVASLYSSVFQKNLSEVWMVAVGCWRRCLQRFPPLSSSLPSCA